MNKRKKRVRRYYKNFKKSNFVFLKNLKNFELAFARTGNKKMDDYICNRIFDYIIRLAIWTNLRPSIGLLKYFLGNDSLTSIFLFHYWDHLFLLLDFINGLDKIEVLILFKKRLFQKKIHF